MTIAKLCLLLTCLLPAVCSVDYCSKTLCGTSQHVACNNAGSFSSKCVTDPKIVTLTPALRKQIVKRHNMYRNKTAGGFGNFKPAARMASMVWNAELAKLAVFNVKQCEMKHDACHNTATFKYSGQNIAISGWGGITRKVSVIINEQIKSWFSEYKDCSMTYINKYTNPSNGKAIGHFTAMVQDKSTAVGCAILRQVNSNGLTEQLMACNYGYTNFMDYPVYEKGTAASKCKTGVNKNFKFLCSINEKYSQSPV